MASAVRLTPARRTQEVVSPMPQQPTEEWRSVPSLDGKYAVSNTGRVKRISPAGGARVGRIIRTASSSTGYLQMGWPSGLLVHRLVAEAFHGAPPTSIHEVNHIDGNRQNNRPDNLEWVTPRQNCLHAYRVLNRQHQQGELSGRAKLTDEAVRFIRTSRLPYKELAAMFGVTFSTIWHVKRRRTWKHI